MAKSKWSGRMPNGQVTDNEEEYFAAWRAVADPIADFLGMQLYAFDPDIALVALDVKGDNTMAIPLWFAKRLLRGIEGG